MNEGNSKKFSLHRRPCFAEVLVVIFFSQTRSGKHMHRMLLVVLAALGILLSPHAVVAAEAPVQLTGRDARVGR